VRRTRRSAATDAGPGSIRRGFSIWWLTLSDGLLRKRRQTRLWSGDKRVTSASVVSGVSSIASLGNDRHGAASDAHSTDMSDAHREDFRPLCTASGAKVARLVVCHLTRPTRSSEDR
jgi:hypothetical protein